MDETHDAGSYWLCGVVVETCRIRETQAALTAVSEKAARVFGFAEPPELHGYDLFSRMGLFKGKPPRACFRIYEDALDAFVTCEPIIVLRGVNRKKIRIMDPHRLAWRYAVEAIDEHGGDGPILIVADRHEATEDALRDDIRDYITGNTGGWKPRTLKKLLPDLVFMDSHTNPLLQASDLVAYLYRRRFNLDTETDSRQHNWREHLWSKVARFVRVSHIWDPPH